VCSNGGSQRGHTVSTPDGLRHVFHHFGSGTLVGADTYLPKEFILNPMVFREEYQELESLGIEPIVYVHPKCIVTTPFDMFANQIIEESRGDGKHGSCGLGIWETIFRNRIVDSSVSALSNFTHLDLYSYVKDIRDLYYRHRLHSFGINPIPKEWHDIYFAHNIITNYTDDFWFMMSKIKKIESAVILNEYENIVFENGQGLLLDQNISGYGVHTTPSNTGITNPRKIIKSALNHVNNEDIEAVYVTRTYLTRHGAGKFNTECPITNIGLGISDKTNVYNPSQENIRYGKINFQELLSRIDYDSKKFKGITKSIAVTHLNETGYNLVLEESDNTAIFFNDFERKYYSDGTNRNSIMEKICC
jgi:adenylosuccinate synthase